MRRIFSAIGISVILAGLMIGYYRWMGSYRAEDFDREILQVEVEGELAQAGVAPLDLEGATEGELWLLANHGPEAYLAEERYPEKALTLYLLFGHTEEFTRAVHENGYQKVIPVMWYFFISELALSYELRDLIGQSIAGFQREGLRGSIDRIKEAWKKSLTPDERAWIALNRILHTNGRYLSQFVVGENGEAHRSQISRALGLTEEILLGDVESLEWKYKNSDAITVGDVAWAVVDVAFLAAVGAKSLHTLSKTGKLAVPIGKHAKAVSATAKGGRLAPVFARTASIVPHLYATRIFKYGAIGFGAYLLYKNPAALNSGLAVVAETMGLVAWRFQLAVWMILIAIPLYFLSFLIIPILSGVIKSLHVAGRLLSWLFKPSETQKFS